LPISRVRTWTCPRSPHGLPTWALVAVADHELTPRRPRRESIHKGYVSLGPTFRPSTSLWPSVFTPTTTITATLTIRPASRAFT
jgi:hypothetical protein